MRKFQRADGCLLCTKKRKLIVKATKKSKILTFLTATHKEANARQQFGLAPLSCRHVIFSVSIILSLALLKKFNPDKSIIKISKLTTNGPFPILDYLWPWLFRLPSDDSLLLRNTIAPWIWSTRMERQTLSSNLLRRQMEPKNNRFINTHFQKHKKMLTVLSNCSNACK